MRPEIPTPAPPAPPSSPAGGPATADEVQAALDALAAGSGGKLLDGFAFERVRVEQPYSADGHHWEDRLVVSGDGSLRMRSLRSPDNRGGAAIGEFATTVDRPTLSRVITAARDARLASLPTPNIHPARPMVTLQARAGGGEVRYTFAGDLDEKPESVRPLLDEWAKLKALALAAPRAAIVLEMSFDGDGPSAADAEPRPWPLTLRLHNPGTMAAWVRHPLRPATAAALAASAVVEGELERCVLIYGREQPKVRGVTPLPMSLSTAAVVAPEPDPAEDVPPTAPSMTVSGKEGPAHLVRIGPGESLTVRCVVTLAIAAAGTYRARATYASYGVGEAADVEGEPRVRGCAFSTEMKFTVG